MKDKFQSLVGMRGACGWLNDPLITHLSPTNHPLKHYMWRVLTMVVLLFTFAIGNVLAVDYSPLNYNGGSTLPSGYKYYGSSAGVENKSAFSTTTYQGHTVFDVTAGGTGAYNKRAIEFTVSEDCTLDIEFYVGNDGRILNLFHGNSTVVHSSTGTTKGDNKYTFSYSFEGITSDQTYSLSGSGSKVYISKITFAPAVACTETAPTSVAVSGGATYDKGDALSNLSAAVTGGTGTMSYQWYRNTTNAATVSNELKLANCTTATLAPSNKVGTYYYYCVASNCAGSVTSNTTAVTINADCSATGDIFTLTMNLENAPTSEVKTPASSTMNIDKYINIDGGDIILATGSSQHSSITTTPRIKLGGSSGYAQITLDCPWQEGDIITFEKTNKIALAADAGGTNKIQLASGTNEYTITKEDCLYNQSNLFVLRDGNNVEISSITITRPVYRTITLEYADGVTPDGSLEVIDGEAATKPADPTWGHHRFDGWYDGSDPYDWTETVGGDLTLTAHWTQLYTVTYAAGDAGATGDAPTQADKAATETFKVAANTFELAGKVFDHWNDGTADYDPEDTYTVGTSNVTLTAIWRTPSTMYAITKGDHDHGDFTISPVEQEEGEIVTLEATPDEDYLFSAWEVVKTEDGSATGITVDANGQFTMPAYAVTVNATFVADERQKVLYVTSTAEATVKANDKLYAALKDIYNVKIVGSNSNEDQTGYDLIVLHESVGGSDYNKTAVATAKAGDVPVLNTKSYFYNSDRWNWGTPNAGQSVKGATQNSAYCNIADHPLFAGVTVTDGFFEITDAEAAKCMQPVGSFTSGKEGYTLATTPNNDSGNGCAIHELTPAQRGASAGKYLMISVSNAKLDALNANGQKLFQNAAAYLIGSASWEPISVPTAAEVTATPSENYTEGNTITLTASATGTSASTTYTWYKGADWATASATTPVQAAATAATDGNVFTKTAALGDEGTYWCNISNGTSCDVQASVTITVSSASTPTHAITYDNTKGADMTAYPTEYTEGIGVASFDDLADITGWHFVEWSPASIAADATTDQTITAVWAQVFEVTFDLQGHGASIDAQDIVSGGKVTKPNDPVAIGWDFGGWFTDAECTAGNEFDFETPITAATPLFAKWTAFAGCTMLYPATSGAATIYEGDEIDMQTGSKGATVVAITSTGVVGTETTLHYNTSGLSFEGGGATARVKVTLDHELAVGSKISLTLMANGNSGSNRALDLYKNTTKVTSIGWKSTDEYAKFDVETFTYTVTGEDGLAGMYEFSLYRNNSVILEKLTIEDCGDPIIFHNLTYAVDPDNDPAYAIVTLGASSVREGYTTTATYSDINAAYEFDEWQISGAGASIADASANPAVITMGTVDAVVTLKLKVATPKHTVTFNKMGTGDDVPSQLVKEGDLVPEPSVAEPEGWILEGWYKESTFETKWNFASDVMGTSDMELFAKWVADASIKLIVDGASGKELNAAAYYTGASLTTVEIADENHACVKLAGGATAATAPYSAGQNDNRVIAYCATTTATKIQVIAYSNTNSARPYTISFVEEGQTADQADDNNVIVNLPTDGTIHTSDWYQFNSTKNRTIYITIPGNASNYHFLQVKVVESGTAIKKAGDIGYSMNFNVGRPIGKKQTLHSNFEGFDFYANNDYKVLQSTSMVISNATNDYIKFHAAAPMTLAVTTETASYFYVTKDAKGTDNEKLSTAGGTSYIDLDAAADWYISPKNGDVKIQNIAFTAPMCAEPTIDAQPVTNVTFGAGNLTASVTAHVNDGGTLSYQWYNASDDSEVTGADEATLTTTTEGTYYVIVTNTLADHQANSTKSDEATLRYRTLNDATLSSLSYGDPETAIALEADKYDYRVILNEGTTEVPALHATATMNPYPIVSITDAASFTDYNAQSTVHVTAEDGLTELTYTVNFIVKHIYTALEDVTGSTTWNWSGSVDQTIDDVPNKGEIIANYIEGDNFEMIEGKAGEYARRNQNGGVYQGTYLHFNTTVPGRVKFYFRAPSGGENCTITVKNGGRTVVAGTRGNSFGWSDEVFVNGDVVIEMVNDKEGGGTTRVQQVVFTAADPDYTRDVTEGRYGTICLPKAGVMVGATLYEIAYYGATSEKIFFDDIPTGEMEAGVPYVFLPNEGVSELGVYYTADVVKPAYNRNGLHGFIGASEDEYYDIPDGDDNYIIQNNQYRYVPTGAWARIKSNRAFIHLTDITPVEPALAPGRKRMSIGAAAPQITTGMDELNAAEAPVKVLINGELFILRGEKMYDATGRLVK